MIMRSFAVMAALCCLGGAAAAQRVDVTLPPRVPSSGGSFIATAAGATVGAATGLTFGILLARPPADGESLDGQLLFVAATTVLGAASGAILGRQATGGHQSVVPSVLGATVGLLAGGWLALQLDLKEPVPVGIAVAIPTGLFTALAGW